MPEETRQNLAETDRGSYCNQEGWFEEFLEVKGAFYNGIKSDDSDNYDENYNEKIWEDSFADVLQNRCS